MIKFPAIFLKIIMNSMSLPMLARPLISVFAL